jgi:ribosomal protein S18 acetylase RimI-like enzyme
VRPPWRRRGLGRALLLSSFEEFRRRGSSRVGLGVDTENATGAVRMYEEAGMRAVRRNDSYELKLSA